MESLNKNKSVSIGKSIFVCLMSILFVDDPGQSIAQIDKKVLDKILKELVKVEEHIQSSQKEVDEIIDLVVEDAQEVSVEQWLKHLDNALVNRDKAKNHFKKAEDLIEQLVNKPNFDETLKKRIYDSLKKRMEKLTLLSEKLGLGKKRIINVLYKSNRFLRSEVERLSSNFDRNAGSGGSVVITGFKVFKEKGIIRFSPMDDSGKSWEINLDKFRWLGEAGFDFRQTHEKGYQTRPGNVHDVETFLSKFKKVSLEAKLDPDKLDHLLNEFSSDELGMLSYFLKNTGGLDDGRKGKVDQIIKLKKREFEKSYKESATLHGRNSDNKTATKPTTRYEFSRHRFINSLLLRGKKENNFKPLESVLGREKGTLQLFDKDGNPVFSVPIENGTIKKNLKIQQLLNQGNFKGIELKTGRLKSGAGK